MPDLDPAVAARFGADRFTAARLSFRLYLLASHLTRTSATAQARAQAAPKGERHVLLRRLRCERANHRYVQQYFAPRSCAYVSASESHADAERRPKAALVPFSAATHHTRIDAKIDRLMHSGATSRRDNAVTLQNVLPAQAESSRSPEGAPHPAVPIVARWEQAGGAVLVSNRRLRQACAIAGERALEAYVRQGAYLVGSRRHSLINLRHSGRKEQA